MDVEALENSLGGVERKTIMIIPEKELEKEALENSLGGVERCHVHSTIKRRT